MQNHRKFTPANAARFQKIFKTKSRSGKRMKLGEKLPCQPGDIHQVGSGNLKQGFVLIGQGRPPSRL